MTAYSEYVPVHERPVITALLTKLIEAGKVITVDDGEEDVVEKTNKIPEIRPELAGTGEDRIYYCDPNDEKYDGYFYLIYNNGSEGDPMVVIADYTVNELAEKIWKEIYDNHGT